MSILTYASHARKQGKRAVAEMPLSEARQKHLAIDYAVQKAEALYGRPLVTNRVKMASNISIWAGSVDNQNGGKCIVLHSRHNDVDVVFHELVHSEDLFDEKSAIRYAMQSGASPMWIFRMYLEGRAAFAVGMRSTPPKPIIFSKYAAGAISGVAAVALGAFSLFSQGVSIPSSLFLCAGACLTYICLPYLPFFASLRRLAKKVGDPKTAFSLSAEKVPLTLRELLSPLKFYKSEIERELAKRKESQVNA